jgi:DNA-binding NarL/FixJ family response regulator
MKFQQTRKKALTVLVLEDNEGDFVLVEDYLIEAFRTVHIERNKSLADFEGFITNQAALKIDIIFLDLHLPDISGVELIRRIRSHKMNAPIIILTGYADIELAKDCLELGVEDFLIKDEISPSMLFKSVEFALSRNEYLKHIEAQNERLRKIAWTQSHVVRAPLARMLSIINLIEVEKGEPEDLPILLNQLRVSANEIDEIVGKISNESQEI